MIKIYTDGAWKKHLDKAGAGVAIIYDDGRIEVCHKLLGPVTNNSAELQAVQIALYQILGRGLTEEEVIIKTDSKYVIGMLTLDWKPKANKNIIASAKNLLEDLPNVKLEWVKGHSKDKYNQLADILANIAVDQSF